MRYGWRAVLAGVGMGSIAISASACSSHAVASPKSVSSHLTIRQVYDNDAPGWTGAGVGDAPPTSAPPPTAVLAEYQQLDCSSPSNQHARPQVDDPSKFLVTCGKPDDSPTWFKFLLEPAVVAPNDVAAASAEEDVSGGTGWSVLLTFQHDAAARWAAFTGTHIGTLVAFVLNGNVFSAATIQAEITGPVQLADRYTKKTATALANALTPPRS